MKPYYEQDGITIYHGDNADILPSLSNLDCCVTDPPYGLSFMGKEWDYDVPTKETWANILNSLKPGAHLLSFFGSRTYHRGVVNIEDAGFEVRDMVEWMYGSGFPKSLNIGNGWGTALKPAHEPIVLARKPLIGTVAQNILAYGTGGINIDGCRVACEPIKTVSGANRQQSFGMNRQNFENTSGRFPANLIHDGSEEVLACFPLAGNGNGGKPYNYAGKEYHNKETSMFNGDKPQAPSNFNDSGSAARFFYCAKASKSERDAGCEELEESRRGSMQGNVDNGDFLTGSGNPRQGIGKNIHPTVKPIALMEYLIKLVTPPNGIILDPFAGSGSTGVAAKKLGFRCVLIERDEKSCEIAAKRCSQELQIEALL